MSVRFACILPILSFALLACRAAPPSAAAESSLGVVRADTEQDALALRDDLEALLPLVHETLPDTRNRPIDVWLQKRLEVFRGFPYPEQIAGMADFDTGRIHVREGDDGMRLHLAHELVHVTVGDVWKRLPGVLEEGLCDLVAVAIVPDRGREQHVKRLVEASALLGGMRARIDLRRPERAGSIRADVRLRLDGGSELTLADALALGSSDVFVKATGDDGAGLYGIGYLVAGRIVRASGFEGLHRLCVRAESEGLDLVPVAWILEASGLNGDREELRRAVLEEFDRPDLVALVDVAAEQLAQTVVDIGRDFYCEGGDVTAEEFLREANPCFSLPGAADGVALRLQPRFREEVIARW